jgi:spore coat protein U-like protein
MIRRLALVALVLLACGAKFAAAANCTISATNIVFGNYTASKVDVTGTLTVHRNPNASYNIGLNAGTSAGAGVNNRSMTGSSTLSYALYSDAGRSTNWGDTSGTGWVSGTGNGSDQIINVYGEIPANQYPTPGTNYSDLITATISGANFSTVTSTFTVSAIVLSACSLSATDLAFGIYSGTQIDSTSVISITCTNTTTYNVGLNAGTATGATVTTRRMTGPGTAQLNYKLFSNSARTINWGNTVATDTLAGAGSGATQSLTVYGRLPAGQYVQPGTYADTIVATVTY